MYEYSIGWIDRWCTLTQCTKFLSGSWLYILKLLIYQLVCGHRFRVVSASGFTLKVHACTLIETPAWNRAWLYTQRRSETFHTMSSYVFFIYNTTDAKRVQTPEMAFAHRPAKNNPPFSDSYWLDNSFKFKTGQTNLAHNASCHQKICFFMPRDTKLMIEEGSSLSAVIVCVQLSSTFAGPHPWGDMDDQGIQLTHCITRLDGRAGRRVRKKEGRCQQERSQEDRTGVRSA